MRNQKNVRPSQLQRVAKSNPLKVQLLPIGALESYNLRVCVDTKGVVETVSSQYCNLTYGSIQETQFPTSIATIQQVQA